MANEKITELDENSSPIGTDLAVIVDDPGSSPASQKITLTNFFDTTLVTAAVGAMSTTAAGKVEAAIASEVNTGTSAALAVTPDSLAGSGYGKRTFSVTVNANVALGAGNGKAYFDRVPSYLNGWNIIEVAANMVAGTGLVTIQYHNLTQTADILSTELTIDANEKDSKDATAPAVIDTTEDDLQTGDRIRVDIDGEGTATTHLVCSFTCQLP